MRVVLDTNVLMAAFAAHGLCEAVFEACLASHEIVVSQHILGELRRHLRGKIKLPAARADAVLSFLRENAAVVTPAKVPADACRDPTDLAVLGTALAARADCLVTGDADLLELGAFRGIPILSPRAFHDSLG
ncbi:MAG: putative toxin-antitoxin system toxin component, PIN family [Planctomycetota bacterium]|nr:putative toxin-antitoxin system toxin component, PIN family [Planctomycetota bacterium]